MRPEAKLSLSSDFYLVSHHFLDSHQFSTIQICNGAFLIFTVTYTYFPVRCLLSFKYIKWYLFQGPGFLS